MTAETYEQAIASTRGVLETVSKQQLGDSTPCTKWKISDLINHMVGGQFWFAAMVNGEEPEGADVDFSSTDYLSAFDEGSNRGLEAFRQEGVMERELTLPFGTMTSSPPSWAARCSNKRWGRSGGSQGAWLLLNSGATRRFALDVLRSPPINASPAAAFLAESRSRGSLSE